MTPPSKRRPARLWLPALLTFIAFALRLHHLDTTSLWYDELLQLDLAQGSFAAMWQALPQHAAMPLDYLLSFVWVRLGRQDFWVHWPPVLAGTLTVPLLYQLGRRMFNLQLGLFAATLGSVSSLAVEFSQEVRPYALLMTLSLLGMLGVWEVYRSPGRRAWVLVYLGFVGAALSHYFALFLLVPATLFLISVPLLRPGNPRQNPAPPNAANASPAHNAGRKPARAAAPPVAAWLGLLAVLLLLMVLLGRLNVLYTVGYQFATALSTPERLTAPAGEKPNRGSGPPLEADFIRSEMLVPFASPQSGPLLLYSLGILAAMLAWLKRPTHRPAMLFLWGWLVGPPLLIYLFLLHRGTFFATRYILLSLPAFLLLTSFGLMQVSAALTYLLKQPSRTILLGTTVLSLLIWGEGFDLQRYYQAPAYENWRAVAAMLAANNAAADAVIVVNAEATMNWYYPPAATPQRTYRNEDNLQRTLAEHPRRWFVLHSYSRRLDRPLRAWLQEQGAVHLPIDRRIEVFYHDADSSPAEHLNTARQFVLPPLAATHLGLATQLAEAGDEAAAEDLRHRAVSLP